MASDRRALDRLRAQARQACADGYFAKAALKWISLMLLVPLPWSTRPWALPFLTILAPLERANAKAKRRHKTTVAWTMQAVKVISRWLGGRRWTLIGDGGYACVRLAHAGIARGVTLISRLRLDARLYAFPDPDAPRRRGPKPLKRETVARVERPGRRGPGVRARPGDSLVWRDHAGGARPQ
jgi:hypothetical protein